MEKNYRIEKEHDETSQAEEIVLLDLEIIEYTLLTTGKVCHMKTSKNQEETAAKKSVSAGNKETDSNPLRPELAEVIERHSFGLDVNRPDAVAKRRQKNQRTARTNVEDLCDKGRFIEYGALAIAAQREQAIRGRSHQ